MKRYLLLLILVALAKISIAQQNDSVTVDSDTINVHGYVLDENRKPIINANIYSYPGFGTKTDKNGFFILKGVFPDENILISANGNSTLLRIYSSRFIIAELKLQAETYKHGESDFKISAKRQVKKTKIYP